MAPDHIERHEADRFGRETVTSGEQIPLLQRSIGQDLVRIDRAMGVRGNSLLGATAEAIDAALLAIAEARQALKGCAA